MIVKLLLSATLTAVVFLLAAGSVPAEAPAEGGPKPAPPPARKVPAITAEDRFPNGCVDCHVVYPELGLDTRLGTLMKRWSEGVEPRLLEAARAASPAGLELEGRHPLEEAALGDIPGACMACHGRDSQAAPELAKMVHAVHLQGGEDNHFMTLFQGECTHCHKPVAATGGFAMPSGPER